MCEHDEACTEVTDPLALALSKRPRERDAVLIVILPPRHDLLAAVYDLPDRGRMTCTPPLKFRKGSLYKDSLDPDSRIHMHAALASLSDYDERDELLGRCHCGTWAYRPADVAKWLAPWLPEGRSWRKQAGLPEPGHDDLAKVRHANGQITHMGRAHAESQGLAIVGTVNRKRTKRPYMLASYVAMADSPDGNRR